MNKVIFSFLAFLAFLPNAFSQFKNSQDIFEAQKMIAICNSYTFLELYNSDTAIIPQDYRLTYTSPNLGLDNKFQIYENGNFAVINLRGSTAKKISWLENFYSSMIPATDKIIINEYVFQFRLSTDTSAAVHAGFTLGLAFIADSIVSQIKHLNKKDIYNITITGHSQGGALAILLRAYLELLPNNIIPSKNKFKTYAFAHPKVGNKAFVSSYKRLCVKKSSYSIINIADPVPKTPISYVNTKINTFESILKVYGNKTIKIKDIAYGKIGALTEHKGANIIDFISNSVHKEICKSLNNADIKMPKYKNQMNYGIISNRIELPLFKYPEILLPEENGNQKKEYKKEPNFFQHKPYNYYVAFLKEFNKKKYNNLIIKVLPENL